MRFARLNVLLLLVLILSTALSAQQISAPTQRDSRALMTIQNAVTVMGGSAAVAQINDVMIKGNLQPASGSTAQSGSFVWMNAGAEFKYTFNSTTSSNVIVSGHGNPANIRNGTVKPLSSYIALANSPIHFPAIVLAKIITDANYSVLPGGKSTVNGTPANKVHVFLNTDMLTAMVSVQDWYFDASTGLPLRVEHRLPDNRRPEIYVQATEDFSNFTVVSGLLVPFQITSSEEGKLVAVETVTSASFNNSLAPSEFDATTGGGL